MALVAGLTAAMPASKVLSCGYDDPQSLSRGALNWTYPDSLYVIGAISREVAARRLPLANFDQAGADLFGRRYRTTKAALDRLGRMLRAASPGPSRTSIALVLVEPMLWTRFEQHADGLRTRVHVSGAEPGDLVLVSGEAVIGEIVAGRLTIGEARTRGLLRWYGSAEQTAGFIDNYGLVGSEPPADARSGSGDTSQQAAMSDARPISTADAQDTSLSAVSDAGTLACDPGHH